MIFTLEALNGQHGDALLLHYGTRKKRELVMIDGGPVSTFRPFVQPRLDALLARRAVEGSLPIRLLMVSHIDDDHIRGVLDMADLLIQLKESNQPLPYNVTTLWHNAFDDVIGSARVAEAMETAQVAGASPDDFVARLPVRPENAAVVQNVDQGRRLRDAATVLGWNVNTPFRGLVSGPGHAAITYPPGLKLTVLGPTRERLDKLQEEWDKELRKARKAKPAEVQDIIAKVADTAAENLSSLIVLAEMDGKRMLLTGDARGDSVVEGLRAAGLMTGDTFTVDVLKVPHHGSKRNVSDRVLQQIVATHYVISANGRNGNPDLDMLKALSEIRGGDGITVHLTNRVQHAVEFLDADSREKNYKVVYGDPDTRSLKVELGDPLPD